MGSLSRWTIVCVLFEDDINQSQGQGETGS